MGLDSVELVLNVEEAFGISIPDENAEPLATMGKLYDYIVAHRFQGTQDACLTSMAFYKIRRALMSVLGVPRDAVRVSTDLAALLPNHHRRTWRAIARASGCRLPILRRPSSVVAVATLAAFALGVAVPYFLGLKPFGGGVITAVLSTGVFGYCLCRLTEPMAIEFPPDIVTVGDLAKATLARNYQLLVAESKKSSTEQEVWDILCGLVVDQFGVRREELTKETNFVEDLKVA